jgi:hypothetical protein
MCWLCSRFIENHSSWSWRRTPPRGGSVTAGEAMLGVPWGWSGRRRAHDSGGQTAAAACTQLLYIGWGAWRRVVDGRQPSSQWCALLFLMSGEVKRGCHRLTEGKRRGDDAASFPLQRSRQRRVVWWRTTENGGGSDIRSWWNTPGWALVGPVLGKRPSGPAAAGEKKEKRMGCFVDWAKMRKWIGNQFLNFWLLKGMDSKGIFKF